MKKINIVFFSANRAEYSLIFPFLKIFSKNKFFNVGLVVSGSHLERKFGFSFDEIKKDKIKIYSKIKIPLQTNKLDNTADYFNKLQKKINLFFNKRNIDMVFISSDRFETLAFAISSYLRKIPIIHYEGGDVTEGGALDDNIRHAITKISNIHLASNENSLKRILKMGEEKWRCTNIGYSQLLTMQKKKFSLKKIKEKFSLNPDKPLILFTFHPVIENKNSKRKDVDEIFKALEYFSKHNQIIVTYPNFDPGYQYIVNKIMSIKKKNKDIKVINHLGKENYHSLLYYIGKNKKGFCMGNSSSGIKESVFFNCPTLNIGDRQKSRLKPGNVVNVVADKEKIITKANFNLKNYKSFKNPYKSKKKIHSIPKDIVKKFKRKDFIQKKCTI